MNDRYSPDEDRRRRLAPTEWGKAHERRRRIAGRVSSAILILAAIALIIFLARQG